MFSSELNDEVSCFFRHCKVLLYKNLRIGDIMEIRLLDNTTIDAQITVFREAFKLTEEFNVTKEKWIKKHYQNPEHNSYIFGAVEEGKIVGINAFMPIVYFYNSKEVKAIQSCESGVLNSHRGKGIWSKIIKFAFEYFSTLPEYSFAYGFPNYENSYKGFVKFGWTTVCEMDNYLLINNGKEFFAAITGKRFFPANLLCIQKMLVGICKKIPKEYSFQDDLDGTMLISNKENLAGFTLSKDLDFLSWKHDYRELKSFVLMKHKIPVAKATYALETYKNTKVILLYGIDVDESCEEDSVKLRKICLRELIKREPQTAFIRYWCINGKKTFVKGLGFLKSKHHNPFIVLPYNSNKELSDVCINVDSWNLSYMDLD